MNTYRFEMISVGMTERFQTTITQEMMRQFAAITGDYNPLHCDPAYASSHGYAAPVVYGMLSAAMLSTLAGMYLPGERSLIHEVDIKFVNPVAVGDMLTVEGTVIEKHDSFQMIVLKISVYHQNGDKVIRGKMQIGMRSE